MKPTQISSSQIVCLKITLDDIKPVIWRRIEVPLTISLLALHEAIQAVMLFENYHNQQRERPEYQRSKTYRHSGQYQSTKRLGQLTIEASHRTAPPK
jgi:hypothetical protein